MLPLTAIFTVASPLAGWTTERVGSRGTVLVGAGAVVASLLVLLGLDTASSVLSLTPALLLAGAGAGFLLVPAINLVVGSAPQEQSGVASGIQQATQQLGGTLGIAVFGGIISATVAQTFGQSVRETSAPADLAAELGADDGLQESIALGFPSGARELLHDRLGDPLATEVTQAAHVTFLNALDTVFMVAIGVVLAAAALSLFITSAREGRRSAEA